ncbi:sugar ABC transporter ATP-binding protein [Geodermatophilus sabuli]|uniref:Ribose transport system ATP-binding protein n=1 Tax=Geodermatophilus sabuli TaxID=1564158 RepID=A0A285E6F5_9ACTN|nr:sugar ABC transporter ATP-binding protein [Geodermatophilus sabuli]MBB3082526.1 ABC-type sugar transport system ATPase subunit [Geodermatophilus sabuli]SNX94605.1 ribose transport system ATP-binding protein [Geodermatophilus sabuli]
MSTADRSAIRCRGLVKEYGRFRALDAVDLDVREATIHALVGQNGAGKSTCLGLLAGRQVPTDGTIEAFGEPVAFHSPRDGIRLGIRSIYQELTIVPTLSTQANLYLGSEVTRYGLLSEREMRATLRDLNDRLGVSIPADIPAGRLSVADQQMLEIMRALCSDARVILLDEPTAALSLTESRALLGTMKELRAQGTTMVLVSHNLEDVLEVSDDITVFRDGRVALPAAADVRDKNALVAAMLGPSGLEPGEVAIKDHARPHRAPGSREVLRVENLTIPGAVTDISFSLMEGELLGLGGLVGSGRTTVLRALVGLGHRTSGRLWIDGTQVKWPSSPHAALRLGIAMIPENRKTDGVLLGDSSSVNIAIGNLDRATRGRILTKARLASSTVGAAKGAGFDSSRLPSKAGTLSGGNQQKLLFARWDYAPVKILLADEPTRGIDIGAKAIIAEKLVERCERGVGVILASSEMEEVTDLCSRVVVLREGRPVGELNRDNGRITVEQILSLSFGLAPTQSQEAHDGHIDV